MKNKTWNQLLYFLVGLGLAFALTACAGPAGTQGPAGPQGPQGVAGPPGQPYVPIPGAGLDIQITSVEIPASGPPVVTVKITDAAGVPYTADVLEGSGFTVAQIVVDAETGHSKYQSLLVREVDGQPFTVAGETLQPALVKTTQAFADSGGTWREVNAGEYTYTFANTLSMEVDPSLTTVVGVYAWKDGRAVVVNDVYAFIPAGGTPTVTREVVTVEACGTCHNPIMIHGGTRRDPALCVTCHTDQTNDPETGNTVDFKVLIHRLHSGTRLPSVQAGTIYQIVGFRQNVFNFSLGTWPQDTRNCTTCHSGGAQSDNYKNAPNAAACTSCHDDVKLAAGENHPGGRVTDDKLCAACHTPEGLEFDASITGAHLIPIKSSQIKGVNFELQSVENTTPGGSPVVTFKVTTNNGDAIAPADMAYLAVTVAGPTTDYFNRVTEVIFRAPSETPPVVEEAGGGAFRYTMNYALPEDATGTFAFALEGYTNETIEGVADPVRVPGYNPVVYVSLSGRTAAPRRQVVDRELCNACHNNLALHGTIRQNTEYCVMCHNPMASDEARRPVEAMPPTSINFRVLIHRVHRGEEMAQKPYIVYGFGGRPFDFSKIIFPGNLAKCTTCHLSGSYGLPFASSVLPTTVTQAGEVISTILPVRAVCTTCHDSAAVLGHIELQTTASGVETCVVCHGTGREFDVNRVHE